MLIGLKPSRRVLLWRLSTGVKMAEGPERKSYKQKIPDFSRTCLAA
jgi:hypothetical protein